jgi:hypothetical protein
VKNKFNRNDNQHCDGTAKTIKILNDENRGNYELKNKDLNSTINRHLYPNYNFVITIPHSCLVRDDVDVITTVFLKDTTYAAKNISKDHVDSTKKAKSFLKTRIRAMRISPEPKNNEAMNRIKKLDNKVRNYQRIMNKDEDEVYKKQFVTSAAFDMKPDEFPDKYLLSDHKSNTNQPSSRQYKVLLYHGDKFVDGKWHTMWIYGSPKLLADLAGEVRMFIDGTFETCPSQFYQSLMIHFIVQGHIMTGVYILLTGKHKELVRWALDVILALVEDMLHMKISWKIAMTDFEKAIVNALQEWAHDNNLLEFSVVCCHFHFCQIILRRAKKCGLSGLFSDQQIGMELRHFIARVMVLPFVPLIPVFEGEKSRVTVMFDTLVEKLVEKIHLKVTDVNHRNFVLMVLDQFVAYANRNYFDETSSFSISQSQWNLFELDDYRTNNNSEGLHNKARIEIGRKPNVLNWILIIKDYIIDDEGTSETIEFDPGSNQQYKKPKTINREFNIGRLKAVVIPGDPDSEYKFVVSLASTLINIDRYRTRDDVNDNVDDVLPIVGDDDNDVYG